MSSEVFTPAVYRAMAAKGYTQEELCARLGRSRRSVVESFDMETACAIEFLLDVPAKELWNIRKGERRALQAGRRQFNSRFYSQAAIAWARRFPVRELQAAGHIAATAGNSHAQRYESGFIPREVMKFMGVAGIAGWEKQYAFVQGALNPHAYSAWVRLGELQVRRPPADFELDCAAIRKNLAFLRNNAITYRHSLRAALLGMLRECDVTVLQVPAFLSAPAPRAASFWKGARPVLMLAGNRMEDSTFMESVYLALAHIMVPARKHPCIVGADKVMSGNPLADAAALRIAEGLLLTEAEECEVICCGRFDERRCIEYFSTAFHVRPGLIVSRLQNQRKLPAATPLNVFKIAV